MTDRITWKDGFHGSEYGYVGRLKLFTIGYSVVRSENIAIHCELPHISPRPAPDKAVAKQRCERLLMVFLNELARHGAVGEVVPDGELERQG